MNGPYSVFLELTNACNAICIHCRAEPSEQFLNELSKKEIFTILDDLMEMGTEFVILTGGEPFCREDLIEIIKYSSHLFSEDVPLTFLDNQRGVFPL